MQEGNYDYSCSQYPEFRHEYAPTNSSVLEFTNSDTTQTWQRYDSHYGVESLDSVFIDGRGVGLQPNMSAPDYRARTPSRLVRVHLIIDFRKSPFRSVYLPQLLLLRILTRNGSRQLKYFAR